MGGGRNGWADVAKGVSIVLVVLWHVTSKDFVCLPWVLDDTRAALRHDWFWLNIALPLRMPLFFLISGVFAARVLSRPWAAVWRDRVAPLGYLFVVWTLVHTALLALTPDFPTVRATSPVEVLAVLTVDPSNLWYLLALLLYVPVARATRSVPNLALAGALALNVVAGLGLLATEPNQTSVLANLLWFLLGTRLDERRLPERLRRVPVPAALLLLALLALAAWGRVLLGPGLVSPRPGLLAVVATLAVAGLGVASGVVLGGLLARGSRAGAATASLGRRTLAVYVIHLPVAALTHEATRALLTGPAAGLADSTALLVLHPALATAFVVAVCLLVHRALLAAGCWWLFAAPWHPPRRTATPPGRHRRGARPTSDQQRSPTT